MNTIYYVGNYDVLRDGKRMRSYSLAAARKMDFVIDALRQTGSNVSVVSPAHIIADNVGYTKSQTEQIKDGCTLYLPPSWSAKNKLSRIVRILSSKLWLFLFLACKCGKKDSVVVYHNYENTMPIMLAKWLRDFRIILEIEEKYSMVWNLSPYNRRKEELLLKQGGKGSLVVSELLAEKLKVEDPIISYGSYNTYRGAFPNKKTDGKVRLVFSGLIDKVRNGAYIAAETMTYLPENYELKISGPIEKSNEEEFMKVLEEVNARCGRCACEYMGVLDDASYTALLLNSDIALNPQKAGEFGGFLFPSKILTYMSHGLPVVSTRGESIIKSQLAELICFADDFTPESVAAAILKGRLPEREKIILKLDEMNKEFCEKLTKHLHRM